MHITQTVKAQIYSIHVLVTQTVTMPCYAIYASHTDSDCTTNSQVALFVCLQSASRQYCKWQYYKKAVLQLAILQVGSTAIRQYCN